MLKKVEPEPPQPYDVPENAATVKLREEPLSSREMYRLSRWIVDWESLAGLMDIAKEQRDHINATKGYHDNRACAEKILSVFNRTPGFSRQKLVKHLEERQLLNVIHPIKTGEWREL